MRALVVEVVVVVQVEVEVVQMVEVEVEGVGGTGLTVLPQVQLVHGVDVTQVGHPGLNLGPALPGGLVDALDHLLLLVDPVQVAAEHRQAHRLQDVGVGNDDPVGSWEVKGQPTKMPGVGGGEGGGGSSKGGGQNTKEGCRRGGELWVQQRQQNG